MGPILELITSYETRIATVEELMTKAYQATMVPDGSLDLLDEERAQLETDLQKTLARHCSLRKKDFDKLLNRVLTGVNEHREAIKLERKQVQEKMTIYLEEHKKLADYLHLQLADLTREKADGVLLNAMINMIRNRYEESGQRIFSALRELQVHLESFRREQEEINTRLQRLADRGESLRIEDLRQLEAARDDQARKADRGLRREEVDRLLAHFRQQRLESRLN
jgi:flagellar biosynthesis chaperone FliJ